MGVQAGKEQTENKSHWHPMRSGRIEVELVLELDAPHEAVRCPAYSLRPFWVSATSGQQSPQPPRPIRTRLGAVRLQKLRSKGDSGSRQPLPNGAANTLPFVESLVRISVVAQE